MSPIEKPDPPSSHDFQFSEHVVAISIHETDDKLKNNCNEPNNNNINNNNSENYNNNKNYLNNHLCQTLNDLPKCNRNRQLFGIQLEVTSLLLEAERRKLAVLQRELQVALEDSGSIKKAKEQLKQELILAISRIQLQYDLLEKEYKQHAIGRLRSSNTRGFGKSNRSQPAIGLKQTPKSRPSIFGTVASDHCPKDNINRRGFPQTVASSSTKSIDKNQSKYQSHHSTISAPLNIEQQHHHQQQAPTITPATATATTHHHQQLENDDNALVYRDGYLISGPLNTLVQHMVPTSDYYPDRSYLFAFLLSARLFIRPHELLAKICQLCDDQQSFSSCWTASTQSNETLVDQHDSVASHHPKQTGADPPNDTTTTTGSNNGDCCRKLRSFAQHFVQLLAEWIETFPYDFRDERLMQHVRSMTRKCISIDSALRKDVSTILQNLLQRLTVLEKYEEFLISLSRGGGGSGADAHVDPSSNAVVATKSSVLTIQNNLQSADNSQSSHHYHLHHQSAASQPLTGSLNTSTTTSSSAATSIDISELCPSPTLLAHQLTHIELERLSYIGPEEFVQAFAKENPHLEQSFSDMKKTRNLESYVQWFNRLSYLVATEIVKHPKKKQRVRIVEYWIETARECFNIGNFNSLMAIIAGLNMSPISRLKKTWAKVQSAKFSVLEHQMDPSSNFNSYRSTLKAAMWRSAGATDERERIVIPFFSLLVKDLYFLNEGCSNKLSNGHINFEKFWQLAKQVTEFIAWKQVTCPFEKLPKVIMFLQTNNVLNENTLAMASFECEPPDNNHEKDRYKTLKSEQQHQNHHQ